MMSTPETTIYAGTSNLRHFYAENPDGRVRDDYFGYWLSGRICPVCRSPMNTNGKQFKCPQCGEVVEFGEKSKKAYAKI
jgi:rubrerythrin